MSAKAIGWLEQSARVEVFDSEFCTCFTLDGSWLEFIWDQVSGYDLLIFGLCCVSFFPDFSLNVPGPTGGSPTAAISVLG